jgi:hypothetical protein
MRHIMLCISGYSGVGKDEFAKRLVENHQAIHTGLADPAKRHMADAYGFSYDQLFGPSSMRNAGDFRLPKKLFQLYQPQLHEGPFPDGLIGTIIPDKKYYWCEGRNLVGMEEIPGADPTKPLWPAAPYISLKLGNARHFIIEGHPLFWLSPREALQKYCELMNELYGDTWIRHGIQTHRELVRHQPDHISGTPDAIHLDNSYDRMRGIYPNMSLMTRRDDHIVTCFSDFRHKHEIRLARLSSDQVLIPVIIRIKHPRIQMPPYHHRSEVEQSTIPDKAFDFVVDNDGTIPDLYAKVDEIVAIVKKDEWKALKGFHEEIV